MKKLLHCGSALFLAAAVAAALSVSAMAAGFSDVPAGHWAYREITECVKRGVISGYGDGTFRPGQPVSVAEFCEMLTSAFYPDAPGLDEGQTAGWYVPSAHVLEERDLLRGTSFAHTDQALYLPITRYDMARLACNILIDFGKSASESQWEAAQVKIADWDAIPHDCQTAVSSMYALGILSGCDGSFRGSDPVSRAQGCVVIGRMLRRLAAAPGGAAASKAVLGTAECVLADGKAVSEANVLAAMEALRQDYPNGTGWGIANSVDNIPKSNIYGVSQQLQQATSTFGIRTDMVTGSGGFAAMCDNRIWGSNPHLIYRRVEDLSQTRPGDLIVRFNNTGLVLHAMVAYGNAYTDQDGNITVAAGQSTPSGRAIFWDLEVILRPNDRVRESVKYFKDAYFAVFTRYPD